jgi:succinate dehydrogenase/fumarate reductase flavoprotein subunit
VRGNAERATYDLIVIGSGPAGEKGAAKATYFGKKVALVEEAPSYGGAVANTAVPGQGDARAGSIAATSFGPEPPLRPPR